MRNLSVNFTEVDKPKKQKKLEKCNDWASPIGWWKIDTEGDVEGRSTTHLGTHYGHIADLAFAFAKECCYSLQFQPVQNGDTGEVIERKATNRKVNISFANGPFNQQKPNTMDVYNWMDIHGVDVRDCCYYGAITIEAMKG
jgi:hypothetical protein